MHIISNPSLRRKGYVYNSHGVGYQATSRPSINWKHIDGPLLYFRDGQLHWLTLWERFLCWVGKADAFSIERKRRPDIPLACDCGSLDPIILLNGCDLMCWDCYCAAQSSAPKSESQP